MPFRSFEQPLEVYTVSDVASGDIITATLNDASTDVMDEPMDPMQVTFRTALDRPGWERGPGWFLVDSAATSSHFMLWLRLETVTNFFMKLPWHERTGRYMPKDPIDWARDHAEFAIKPASSEQQFFQNVQSTRGQLIKGWWLKIIPVIDGKVMRVLDDGAFRCQWTVGDVTAGKSTREWCCA